VTEGTLEVVQTDDELAGTAGTVVEDVGTGGTVVEVVETKGTETVEVHGDHLLVLVTIAGVVVDVVSLAGTEDVVAHVPHEWPALDLVTLTGVEVVVETAGVEEVVGTTGVVVVVVVETQVPQELSFVEVERTGVVLTNGRGVGVVDGHAPHPPSWDFSPSLSPPQLPQPLSLAVLLLLSSPRLPLPPEGLP